MAHIAFLGDTMLGRLCADRAGAGSAADLCDAEVRATLAAADLVVANLECCISSRGERWPAPGKPFFFRAQPSAARLLADLGVDVITLANNHALDYGSEALTDTLGHLARAGVAVVGAGATTAEARAPAIVSTAGLRVAIIGVTDHPADYAAGADRPGTAYADLRTGVPGWLTDLVRDTAADADLTVVTPHWGPNMTTTPVPHVRAAAPQLVAAGATIVAGHSAHVFHGVAWQNGACVMWDVGDFFDDYAADPLLRNDLGVLCTVEVVDRRPVAVEVLPLRLETCRTARATDDDAAWVAARLEQACAPYGTTVTHRPADGVLRCVQSSHRQAGTGCHGSEGDEGD